MIHKIKVLAKKPLPEWFLELNEQAQQDYLDKHKNSELYLQTKREDSDKVQEKETRDYQNNNTKTEEKRKAPSNKFTGPKDDAGSAFNKPNEERKVVRVVTQIAKLAKLYKEKGKDFPDFDLCEVTIPGTNLFCELNKGIARKNMPQLKGKPAPGTWAEKQLKDGEVEYDGEKEFKSWLSQRGVKIEKDSLAATSLKSTQSQLVGEKVAGMFEALKKDPKHKGITAPIFISRDGYVLDGHHRWVSQVIYDLADGVKDSVMMDVEVVDMDIDELVQNANQFSKDIGIAQKTNTVEAKLLRKYGKYW